MSQLSTADTLNVPGGNFPDVFSFIIRLHLSVICLVACIFMRYWATCIFYFSVLGQKWLLRKIEFIFHFVRFYSNRLTWLGLYETESVPRSDYSVEISLQCGLLRDGCGFILQDVERFYKQACRQIKCLGMKEKRFFVGNVIVTSVNECFSENGIIFALIKAGKLVNFKQT